MVLLQRPSMRLAAELPTVISSTSSSVQVRTPGSHGDLRVRLCEDSVLLCSDVINLRLGM